MADGSAFFSITHVSPTGGSTFGDTMLTLRGSGLLQLRQAQFRPRFNTRLIEATSDDLATIVLPCRTMGPEIHTLTFLLHGRSTEYAGSGGTGLRFICFNEPRYDGLRPVLGPSFEGLSITLTSTLVTCTLSAEQRHRCNPPPLNLLDERNLLSGSTVQVRPRRDRCCCCCRRCRCYCRCCRCDRCCL